MQLKCALCCLCLCMAQACSKPARQTVSAPPAQQVAAVPAAEPEPTELHFSNVNGTLWAHQHGRTFKLPLQGQTFQPLQSPDGEWLAVEVQQLSDLRTLRIFRQSDQGYTETAQNASTHLWQRAAASDALNTDELRSPAIRVIDWRADSSGLSVELRALTGGAEDYRRTIDLSLDDLAQ